MKYSTVRDGANNHAFLRISSKVTGLPASGQATVVLSDDRLLRKTAVIEGIRVIGTIGILIRATKASLLAAKKSVELLDELVEEHNFRISTRVYEIARNAVDQIHPNGA